MQDGEIAIVGKSSVEFFDSEGKPIDKKLMHITWDADSAEKGGYKHFMKKEIAEQPKAVRDTLSGRIVDEGFICRSSLSAMSRLKISALSISSPAAAHGTSA